MKNHNIFTVKFRLSITVGTFRYNQQLKDMEYARALKHKCTDLIFKAFGLEAYCKFNFPTFLRQKLAV